MNIRFRKPREEPQTHTEAKPLVEAKRPEETSRPAPTVHVPDAAYERWKASVEAEARKVSTGKHIPIATDLTHIL